MTLVVVTTRSRWFTCIRLLWYSPDGIAVPPFPVTFTTMALYHSSLRWFEASTCKAASRGPPSSSIKHGLKLPSSPSWHTATENLQPLHLEDGGPLTDNVVLSSDQRVLVLKRAAVLMLATWNMQLATALSNKQPLFQEQLLTLLQDPIPPASPLGCGLRLWRLCGQMNSHY